MKKLFAAVLFTALVALSPATAQTGNVAVGPVYGISFLDLSNPLGQGLGITGKIPGVAPLWGLNFSLSPQSSNYFLGLTADWLLYKQPLYSPFNINFYMGPGFYTSLSINSKARFDAGLRIPFGVNWTPIKFLEIFTELTPAFGIKFQDPIQPAWIIQAAVGARIWF